MKYLLCAVLFLVLAGCRTKKEGNQTKGIGCEKFKTGTFSCYSITQNVHYKVFRNDTIQREITTDDVAIKPQRIKWINPCVYEISVDENNQDELDKEIGTITVTIFKINGDTCFYKTAVTNPDFPEMRGYFIKLAK